MRTITLKSYDKVTLFCYSLYLKNLFKKHGILYTFFSGKQISGKVTLLKSPHVYKKFKEHYRQDLYTWSFTVNLEAKKLEKIVSLLNAKANELIITLS